MIQNGKYAGVKDTNVTPDPDANLSIWQQSKVRECYRICAENGVDIPDVLTLENLPSYVRQIAGDVPKSCFELVDGELIKKQNWDLTPTESIGAYSLYCFYNHSDIKTFSFSTVKSIGLSGCESMFGLSDLESVDVSGIEIIKASGFRGTFMGAKIKELVFSKLTSLTGGSSFQEMCYYSRQLTKAEFPVLSTISGSYALNSAFVGTKISELSFPALSHVETSNQFDNMLLDVSGCTVHFPANLESVMGQWPSVLGGFGGTNTVVLFDLPATE